MQSDLLPTDKIIAEDWNKIVGLSQRPTNSKNSISDATGNYIRINQSKNEIIRVRNASGSERQKFDILELTGIEDNPSDSEPVFLSQIYFTGGAITASGQPFCVLAERLPAGVSGRAIFHGMTRVKINISDASHQYADISAGVYANLVSAETGAVKILWKESGTGTKWAVVLLGAGGGGGSSYTPIIGQVIERPSYSIDGVPGRNHYTIRLLTDSTTAWSGATTYALNEFCIGSDNKKYISLQADNTNHNPTESPTWWSQSEEIRITKIWGQKNLSQLIENTFSWVEPGEDVILYQDGEGEYYILNPPIIYGGDKYSSNLRYNPTRKCPQAVFA